MVKSYGEGGLDALVVPAFLAGATDVLSAPTAAAVEGPVPCDDEGNGECWILALAREGGLQSRLWVDTATSLVRQAEVRMPSGSKRSRIRVRHEQPVVNPPLTAADLTFDGTPPALKEAGEPEEATEVLARSSVNPWALPRLDLPRSDLVLEGLAGKKPAAPSDPARLEPAGGEIGDLSDIRPEDMFQSEITVSVAPIVVRVVSGNGQPLLGLQPEDFRVRAGKREIPVLAVDWTSQAEMLPDEEAAETLQPEPPAGQPSAALELLRKAGPSPGKWVLLFVQAGDEPIRTKGHLALLPQIDQLVSTLEPQDRVAVVSFDSRLRLRLDWTLDRADLLEALRRSIRFGGDFSLPGDGPAGSSLTRFLAPEAAAAAANPERALELVAEALGFYRGEKVVVFLGFALGRRERVVTPAFQRAAEKLNSARASVFVLDVFQNDNHELAAGLKTMAVATGGTYASTYLFPSQAIKRLAQAISGYYVLTLDADELPWNGELLRIELRDKKKGTVVVRPTGSINTGVLGSD